MNDFNALLAQVIPVLLLAAAFESRWLQRRPQRYSTPESHEPVEEASVRVHRDTNPFQPIGMFLFIAFIGFGEIFALWAVFVGHGEPWQNAWVLVAGVMSLLLVVGPLLALHLKDLKEALSYGVDWSTVLVIVIFLWLAVQIAYSSVAGVTALRDSTN